MVMRLALKDLPLQTTGMYGRIFREDGHQILLNKFSIAGRNPQEEGIWRYIAKLANFRKASTALTTGKMMQYAPEEGLYVYFRYDNDQTVMVTMNISKETQKYFSW